MLTISRTEFSLILGTPRYSDILVIMTVFPGQLEFIWRDAPNSDRVSLSDAFTDRKPFPLINATKSRENFIDIF